MIVFANHSWQTDASAPDSNYLEGIDCEQPKWVVPDNSELAGKMKSAHYWTPVEDDKGNLIDIIPVDPPVTDKERILFLKNQLEELDRQAIRPLRAIAAGNDTEEDREILADLERQAAEIRTELERMEGENNG